jgi:cytochrome c
MVRPAILVLLSLAAATTAHAQDAKRGKALFAPCARCHSFDPKNNDLAPNLRGVVGRKAAAVKGFEYSGAMRHSFIVWDEASLNAYLAQPRVIIPRTTMRGAGVDVESPQDRQDLIAYMKVAR